MKLHCAILAMVLAASIPSVQADELVLDRDNIEITADAVVKPGTFRVVDADGNGVVHITGNDITVDFQGAELIGAGDDLSPDKYTGQGIVITGQGITLKNARVRGFKIGIWARNAPNLRIEDVDVSGNFRQRLRSTASQEDLRDWLSPHRNDNHEWLDKYGAGLCIERSDSVVVQRVRAREGQNGIVLDRVNDSRICDNDCSFLSGWGLALWRCSRNLISRNAFDFCVRGYSHGVYNRGQDSAGILMFEQNNENVIVENSATHCGDGLFGFGGTESLAGTGRTGNNRNLIMGNDFSYAAAHGIEMTFSFENRIIDNVLIGNAICGIWGGYSQDTVIAGNRIEANGEAGYGSERGGVNIEHGCGNRVTHNTFRDNRCGVFLWSDEDTHLMKEPWVQANHRGSTDNVITENTFEGDGVGVELRDTTNTLVIGNVMSEVRREIKADSGSEPITSGEAPRKEPPPTYPACGERSPVGARQDLAGRNSIVITEWGPYEFAKTAIVPNRAVGGDKTVFQLLAPSGRFAVASVTGNVQVSPMEGDLPAVLTVESSQDGVESFRVDITANGEDLQATGSLFRADWQVRFFAWNPTNDPRTNHSEWDGLLRGPAMKEMAAPSIDFDWGLAAPAWGLPADQFGTLATTSVDLPAGEWIIRTVSDDGIRVWVDDQLVIDEWSWHPPKEDTATVKLSAGKHNIRLEHFEINGYAALQFRLEPAPQK